MSRHKSFACEMLCARQLGCVVICWMVWSDNDAPTTDPLFIMASKPSKSTPDFPLTARNNGQWAKKIKGKFHHFGPWADPQAALDHYNAQIAGTQGKPITKSISKNGRLHKPHKDSPLYAHHNGQRTKEIRGVRRKAGESVTVPSLPKHSPTPAGRG